MSVRYFQGTGTLHPSPLIPVKFLVDIIRNMEHFTLHP